MNRHLSVRRIRICFITLLLGGCANDKEMRVQLEAHHQTANEPSLLNVQAQVTGPQSGLSYKWFSVLGEFEPQDSYVPRSTYSFAPSSSRDRIWVEVWRDNERVAQGQLDVHMDSAASERPAREPPPHAQITITQIPRYDPAGGPDTRADISGRVSGDFSKGYSVILYARADAWYIQPVPYALHPIAPDNTWKSWTHTGSNYAALIVGNDYKPLTRLDVLPPVEGGVIARTIVEGKKP
jgi:hypothetical protein